MSANMQKEKMFAGVVHGRENLRYEEMEKPVPQAGEVLIKVKYTGICGSDVPRVNGDACHFFPIVLGHEFSGQVVEVGQGVNKVKVGQRVAGVPLVPCMECDDCRKGNFSLCKHYSFIGSRRNGSFAQYVVVPEANAVPFSDDTSYKLGAFFEPSTVAIHALECVNFRGGSTVVVLGAGTIGLLTLQWAKIYGAKKVVVVNRSRGKLDLALKLGADAVVSTLDEDYKEQLSDLTDGKGFDYVFETAGSTDMMKFAFEAAGNKAKICNVGTPKTEMTFSVKEWEYMNRKEFTVTGSWMSYSAPFPGKEWELTAHYFGTGDLKILDEMIFEEIPLSEIDRAFELYKKGSVGGKILIDSER